MFETPTTRVWKRLYDEGKLSPAQVTAKSLAGEPCFVKHGIEGPVRIEGSPTHPLEPSAPGIQRLDLQRGGEVLLISDH